MKYLIDTDIASYYLRGKYALDKALEKTDPSELTLSAITVAEMQVLAHRNPASKVNLSTINKLAQWTGILGVDQETWEIFSRTKAETLDRGEPRGDLDILQASLALQHNLIIVTHNTDHYEGIVDCEDWAGKNP